MKLVISEEELKQAVAEYLGRRGFEVTADIVTIKTRAEGQYEDQTLHLDGAEVGITAPQPKETP